MPEPHSPDDVRAAGRLNNLLDLLQQAQFLEARHQRLDVAHGQTPLPTLLKEVGAEAAHPGHVIGEVHLALFLQPLDEVLRGDLLHHVVHPLLGRRRTLDGHELAVDAEDCRL